MITFFLRRRYVLVTYNMERFVLNDKVTLKTVIFQGPYFAILNQTGAYSTLLLYIFLHNILQL